MLKAEPAQLLLETRHLKMLQQILQQYIPNSEVWAYGSRVTGGAHEGSDLDLVARNPQDLSTPITALAKLQTALTDSNLPMLIDLHDWALLPEEFQRNIEKVFVVVQ